MNHISVILILRWIVERANNLDHASIMLRNEEFDHYGIESVRVGDKTLTYLNMEDENALTIGEDDSGLIVVRLLEWVQTQERG